MNWLPFAIIPLTCAGMELFSWFFHKYFLHGPLWFIHQTHHKPQNTRWEWNDMFSLLFTGISIYLIVAGLPQADMRFWIGCGISLYGLIYFVVHDMWIHQRMGKRHKLWRNAYLLKLRRAHKLHHKSVHKTPSGFFGLLWTKPR